MITMETFYAKVLSTNKTSYDTNTLSVLIEEEAAKQPHQQRPTTIRIDENIMLKDGDLYLFETALTMHNDKEQPLVKEVTHINDLDISLNEQENLMRTFYSFAPVDIEKVKANVEIYLNKITNETIKKITHKLYKKYEKAFYLYPAATRFHHAYIGGLAHHTETMLRLSDGLLNVYPFLDESLLISGIILHDVM